MTKLTIVVAWDFIPGFSKLKTLLDFYESTKCFFGIKHKGSKYILALDKLHPRYNSRKFQNQFRYFVESISNALPELQIATPDEWGHLTNNLENAFRFVDTEYVLVCQADLPFVDEIPISKLLPLPENVSHLLFSKHPNPSEMGSIAIDQLHYGDITLLKTNIWSDNNHLCKANYYRDLVFPLAHGSHTFPETAMTRYKEQTQRDLGTFIFGGLGMGKVINHTGEDKRIYLFIERYFGNIVARIWFRSFGDEAREWSSKVIKYLWLKYALLNSRRKKT